MLAFAATRADASPGAALMTGGTTPSTWFLVGGNGGAIIGHGATTWLAGAEASIVRVTDTEALVWYGGYADILHDASHGGARISAGGEVGASMFGLDGGLVEDLGDDRLSIRIRPSLTIGVASVYAGWVIPVAGTTDHDAWTEVGLLAKLPFTL